MISTRAKSIQQKSTKAERTHVKSMDAKGKRGGIPDSPHIIGTDGNETWENGEWSMTYQVKGGDPLEIKGYHVSIAVREGGVWKKRMLISNITLAPAVASSSTGTPNKQ